MPVWCEKKVLSPHGTWKLQCFLPEREQRGGTVVSLLICLIETEGREAAQACLARYGVAQVMNHEPIVAVFPQMPIGGWRVGKGTDLSDDERMVQALFSQAAQLLDGWRDEAGCRYLIGEGSGADIACRAAASFHDVAAVCASGGDQPLQALEGSPLPVVLHNVPTASANLLAGQSLHAGMACTAGMPWPTETFPWKSEEVWMKHLTRVRRVSTSPQGDVALRHRDEGIWVKDELLDDGHRHSFLVYPPKQAGPCALMLVSHGMGDSPAAVAQQTGMHRVSDRVLTVYPMASKGLRWNLNCTSDMPDDHAYYDALITWLSRRYPVDSKRIYTSGFSNGAGMAMSYALMRPEKVAASCPIDSTFPYATTGRFTPHQIKPYLQLDGGLPPFRLPPSVFEEAMAPLRQALARQHERSIPLKLPVMYFYGTRESEFPIRSGSNQELSMNFWKEFNGIPFSPADDSLDGDDAVGTPGKEIKVFSPEGYYRHHRFTEHIFYDDQGLDAYHFVLMHGKTHEVHPCEAMLGWQYVSRFARGEKGELIIQKGDDEQCQWH